MSGNICSKSNGGGKYYCYVSTRIGQRIQQSKKIKMNNGKVILTTLKPEDHFRDDILHAIYGGNIPSNCKNMADNVVLVDGSKLNSSKLLSKGGGVYEYSDDIAVSSGDVIDKPRCVNQNQGSWGSQPSNSASSWSGQTQSPASTNVSSSSTLNSNNTKTAQSGNSNSNVGGQYYCYVSTRIGQQIQQSNKITMNNGKVILTTLKPEDHFRDDILHAIYGGNIPSNCKNMADNVVLVDGSNLNSSKLLSKGGGVYEYSDDIVVSSGDVIDKPSCVNQNQGGWGSKSSSSTSSWSGQTQSSASTNVSSSSTLYHYTNTKTAQNIKKSGTIAMIGNKVLLTSMKPQEYFRNEILKAIHSPYDPKMHADLADYCVKVNSTNLDKSKLTMIKNEVYEYRDNIQVPPSCVMDKPKCSKQVSSNSPFSPSNDGNYLYHYTNKKGADAIKSTGYIKTSGSSGAFGPGVYMTDLKPTDFFRDDIINNNYGKYNGARSAFLGRADYVVRVNIYNLDSNKLKKVGAAVTGANGRNIYCYDVPQLHVQASDVCEKPTCYRAI